MKVVRLVASGILIAVLGFVATVQAGHAAPAGSSFDARSNMLTALHSHITPQGPSSANWYDINSSDFYCADGTTNCVYPCIENDQCAGAVFAAVDAIGTTPGANSGTPGEIVMECIKGNQDGTYTAGALDVYTAAQQAEFFPLNGPPYFGQGSLTGTASLVTPNAGEDTPNAVSSLHVSAIEPYSTYGYERGTVTGVQNTDNNVDTLNSGGFTITISGVLDRYSFANGSTYYNGTITCTAGGPKATQAGTSIGVTTLPEDSTSTGSACAAGTNLFYQAEGEMEADPYDEYDNFDSYNPFDFLLDFHSSPCSTGGSYDFP